MTDAELAILSIVAEGPVHGYDLQTIITQRGLRDWTNIGVSSMYYVLEKLERQGLIESKAGKNVEGPARRQYRITPAGFGVLQTSVADLLSTPRDSASFELGLANLHVLRPSQIRTALIAYRQELASRITTARDRWNGLRQNRAPFNVDAMFGHHVALLEAEMEWIKTFIEDWEAQAPPEDAPTMPEPLDIPRMKQVVLPRDPDSPHRAPTRPLYPPRADAEAEGERPRSMKKTVSSRETPPSLVQPPDQERSDPPDEDANDS
jgi:DNA-binding PadR family transcriptional regulator